MAIKNCKGIPAKEIFSTHYMKDDLLNLFNEEETGAELSFKMLEAFIKNNMAPFQTLPNDLDSCWMSEWSDVNGWSIFWVSRESFNCIGHTN